MNRRTWAKVDPNNQRDSRKEGGGKLKTPSKGTNPSKNKIGSKSKQDAECSLNILQPEYDDGDVVK